MMAKILKHFKISLSLSKFCQARGNIFLFRLLPFWASRWYLAWLGKLYFFLNRQEKRLIRQTICHTMGPGREGKELRGMIRRVFQGIIDHYHEKLFVAYSNFPRLLKFLAQDIRLEGEDELNLALALGQGVILVTGHYGAVEFLPGSLAVRGYPVSMICRFQTNGLKESLYERARAVNLNLIDAGEGNVFLAAVKALKSGQILITECDEFDEWRTDERQGLNFLGCRLPGDKTLDILRKRSGASVVSALVQRNGGRSYTLNLTGIAVSGNGAQAPVGVRCLKVLEQAVLADPPQWYQWKKFGKMIYEELKTGHAHQEPGYLAPEVAVSLPV